MFAVGHLAFGYMAGKSSSKLSNVNINIPLILSCSITPDIDLIIPGLEHRGPTHSIVIYAMIFLPAFMIYKRKVIPYFASLAQHSFVGDLLTGGGVQTLWPLTSNWYGVGMKITSLTNVCVEWTVFLTSLTLMLKTKDLWTLFHHHPSNLMVTVPVITIILPSFLSFPLAVPLEIIIPHLIYLTIFSLYILIDLRTILKAT